MELLIRSQDKTILTKINEDLYLYGNFDKTFIIKTDKWQLGTYKTKERALEVLDEISNILKLKNMYEYDRELVLKGWQNCKKEQVETVREQMSVYEMPKE